MKRFGIVMAFFLMTVTVAAAAAATDGLAEVGARMQQRVVRIGELKLAGIIGETHDGFLAVADATRADAAMQTLVQNENADRRLVYQALAVRAGTDAATVGGQRAKTIHEQGAAGLLFRDEAGEWQAKK